MQKNRNEVDKEKTSHSAVEVYYVSYRYVT